MTERLDSQSPADKSSESPPNGPTFLSCPFCGKAPDPTDRSTLHPSGTYWHFEAEIGCRAYHGLRERCDGDGECYVMTCLTEAGGCGARVSGDSEAEAVAAWNRRCARSAGTRITRQEAVTLFCEIGNRRLHEMEAFNLTENMRATIAEFAERLTARSARTFSPTHVHIDGGYYRLVERTSYKTSLSEWSDAIIYEDKDGKLWVTTPARWSDRFASLENATDATTDRCANP